MPADDVLDIRQFTDEPDPTWTHWLAIHYSLSDDSTFTFNVPDYSDTATDEEFKDNAVSIMQQNVFAPMGLSLVGLKGIEKIDTRKTPVVI